MVVINTSFLPTRLIQIVVANKQRHLTRLVKSSTHAQAKKDHHRYWFHDQLHPLTPRLIVAWCKICEVSVISTIKVDLPVDKSSAEPIR
jgi:2-phosphoglycerate kinase